MELTLEQGRVLGSLVEKELTTPQGYPLTDNALLTACNQTTSRDPVVQYDTATVRVAVRELRELGLLRTVHRPGERSDKHRHELAPALDLSPAQVALLGVLLLRGPQTPAELRARTERMHPFATTEQAEDELVELPQPRRAARRPARAPARAQGGAVRPAAHGRAGCGRGRAVTGRRGRAGAAAAGRRAARCRCRRRRHAGDEVAALRAEVALLRAEVEALRQAVAQGPTSS